jgi:hypothetical protein
MPTDKPLMKRPTISMAMFCEAQTMMEPTHLGESDPYSHSNAIKKKRKEINKIKK